MAEDIIAVTREEFVRAVETLGLPSASATYLDTMAAVFGVRRDGLIPTAENPGPSPDALRAYVEESMRQARAEGLVMMEAAEPVEVGSMVMLRADGRVGPARGDLRRAAAAVLSWMIRRGRAG